MFHLCLEGTSPAIVVVPTEVTPSEATLPLQHACDNMHGNQLPDTTSSLDDYTGRLNTTAATFLSKVNFSIQLEVIFPINRLLLSATLQYSLIFQCWKFHDKSYLSRLPEGHVHSNSTDRQAAEQNYTDSMEKYSLKMQDY